MKTLSLVVLLLFSLVNIEAAKATPRSSKVIAAAGVVAHQDDSNVKQFHYIPLRTDLQQNYGIIQFSARYWGIGPAWYTCPGGNTSDCFSSVGGILGGVVNLDISRSQEKTLRKAISAAFGIKDSDIIFAPAKLRDVKVEPVFAGNTLEFGANSDQKFPSSFDIGSSVNYTLGTGGSTFAAVIASGDVNSWEVLPNPLFGMNIAGNVEVIGDPWVGSVSCKLDQVWKEIRKSFSASVSWGWFELGKGSYDGLWKDLTRSGACTLNLSEGSMDNNQYGQQMFDLAKKMFEEINSKAQNQVGFFKFEPLPDAEEARISSYNKMNTLGLFSSLSRVKVNASYSERHFSQTINWSYNFSYTGRYKMPVYVGVTLALACTQSTKHLFYDIGKTSEPCITQEKIDIFNDRIKREVSAKNKAIAALFERYLSGDIDEKKYQAGLLLLKNTNLSEQVYLSPAPKDHQGIVPAASTYISSLTVDDAIAEFLNKVK